MSDSAIGDGAADGVTLPDGGLTVSDLTAHAREPLATPDPDPDITIRRRPDGQGRPGMVDVDLVLEGQQVSTCKIVPLTLRIGAATVRMDGIGDVGTLREYRGRGYSRRVLTAAIAHMAAGDAALTMLYGIPNFYPKFGYTTAGPAYTLSLPLMAPTPPLPSGWQVRPARPTDLPAMQRLYDRDTADAVGAALRSPDLYPWTELARLGPGDLAGECRVVVALDGEVAAYAWAYKESWFVHHLAQTHPHSLALAEVVARDAIAADAILAACRTWGIEEAQATGQPLTAVVLALPPAGPVAAAAIHGSVAFQQTYSVSSEFMVRVLHAGRLLSALVPELERRLRAALPAFQGTLRLDTDVGSATLRVSPDGLTVEDSAPDVTGDHTGASGGVMVVPLPQTTLARLALGAFSPADLLERLEKPPADQARALLEAMFPPRYPHLSLPDRF